MDKYNGQKVFARHKCGEPYTYFAGGLYCDKCQEPSESSPPSVPYVQHDTSIEAAHFQASSGKASGDEARVLKLIRERGGCTDDEIEVALNLRHQTASARRRGLVLKGLVVETAGRRKTRSGRRATVWRAT